MTKAALRLPDGSDAAVVRRNSAALKRHTFTTSRLLEFTSERELALQTGHPAEQWPLVIAKELGDNALDACEEKGIAPDLSFTVTAKVGEASITVTDNGPGIPPDTVAHLLDFSVRVSSREAYVSPTRGAQGNALKTLIAMPFALDRDMAAPVIIDACGVRHSIRINVDAVKQHPIAVHEQESSACKNGTAVTVPWPDVSLLTLREQKTRFLQIVHGFALLNPHATVHVDWNGQRFTYKAIDPDFSKWLPSNPTPPCWYDAARFERLLAAYGNENGSRTVREFVSEFRGLSGSAKVAEVLDDTGLARITVGQMFTAEGKPRPQLRGLLDAMQQQTSAVKPADLGVIGKYNLMHRFAAFDADLESFEYKRVLGTDADDLPYVIEAAFAHVPDPENEIMRAVITGVNFSPAIVNPFRQLGLGGEGLERVLAGQRVESTEPVIVAVHFTCPVITYLDRGKSSIALGGGEPEAGAKEEKENPDFYLNEVNTLDDDSPAGQLIMAVKSVTKRWFKQRKAEDRNRSARINRQVALQRSRRVTQKQAAFAVMEQAYLDASANDTLPANARQVMYAARDEIQTDSGKPLNDSYFTQTLLPDYIAERDPEWKDNVAYDDRGHFSEPHTEITIGVGTLAVRGYLGEMAEPSLHAGFDAKVKTCGPSGRFGGALFVEKEGFDALFESADIARRYDLAFMSCKGISVTAARELADQMCAEYDIPLYVLTDFDKSGFVGAGTFERDNRRYTYQNKIKVVRLGLRLDDVRAIAAQRGVSVDSLAEKTYDRGEPEVRRRNMRLNGASAEEAEFLLDRRVELNALRSDELVAFVERKLQANAVHKLVPSQDTLADAYCMFTRGVEIRQLVQQELAKPDGSAAPADLEQRVRAYLLKHPEVSWDYAVAVIAGWAS